MIAASSRMGERAKARFDGRLIASSTRRLPKMHTLEKLTRVGILAVVVICLPTVLPEIGRFVERAARRILRRSRPS